MEYNQFIEKAYEVFSKFKKPEYCTRYPDLEDAEFNEILISVTNRDLSVEQLGVLTWSPISCMNSESLAYFMPRLIELAITGAIDRDGDPFFCHFINVFYEGPADGRFKLFAHEQKQIMAGAFDILCQNYAKELEYQGWLIEAQVAIKNWALNKSVNRT